jgi:hypothetical protein
MVISFKIGSTKQRWADDARGSPNREGTIVNRPGELANSQVVAFGEQQR